MRPHIDRLTSNVNEATQLWQFSRHIRRSEFVSALRISQNEGRARGADQRYCLYRLGCYLSATDGAKDPRSARETVALAASYAALGKHQEYRDVIEFGLRELQRRGNLLIEAARALARYDPKLSLDLVSNIGGQNCLKAALAYKIGDTYQANYQIIKTLERSDSRSSQECQLVLANLEDDPGRKLLYFNAYLRSFGLVEYLLIDGLNPLSSINIMVAESRKPCHGPLVTVVMPAYQAEKWITSSVTSLTNQTYTNLEIIVVDDGSTDETQNLARAIASRDDRVRYIRLEQNFGAYSARNIGMRVARGEFFTVNDADDYAHPEKIERQIKPMLRSPEVIFTLSDLVRVRDDGVLGYREVYPIQRLNPSSLLFRRDQVMRELGCWEDVRFGADSEFIFRLKNAYPSYSWRRIKEPLTLASSHENSLTASRDSGNTEFGMNLGRIEYTESYVRKLLCA